MKKQFRLYSLYSLVILMTSCINSAEKIDYIADDYQITSYQYILSEKGILKSIHSENDQIILYNTEFNEIATIESFNYGAYFISDLGKDTIVISFLKAKSDSLEPTYFLNHVVELGDYKICYRFYDLTRFSNSGEEIIDSVYFKKGQFSVQLFRDKQLIDDLEIKNMIFDKKRITYRTIEGDSAFFKEYIMSKGLTPQSVIETILDGYKNK